MNVASTASGRWAVSTRSHGELQTAGISTPALELVLLGIPAGYTHEEADGWLHDLGGVALETSRDDSRARAIPPLLHHALTGLLFSQAELWIQPGRPAPCSAAFVDTGDAAGFGWVGEAKVEVLVEGEAFEPQWVIVRDQDGREARAAILPTDRMTQLAITYTVEGDATSDASIEAFWFARDVGAVPAPAPAPLSTSERIAPAASEAPSPAPALAGELQYPDALPLQQPSLADAPRDEATSNGATDWLADEASSEPAAYPDPFANVRGSATPGHGSSLQGVPPAEDGPDGLADRSGEWSRPEDAHGVSIPHSDSPSDDDPGPEGLGHEATAALESLSEPHAAGHPVGRWLGKLLGFARRATSRPVRERETERTPVSAYDALLSNRVEPTHVDPAEQTSLELPQVPLPDPMGSTVSDFDDAYLLEAEADFRPETPAAPAPASDAAPAPAVEADAEAFAFDVMPVTPVAPVAPDEPAVTDAPVASAETPDAPLEITPAPRPPVEEESMRAATVRRMHEADASALPVLPSPPVEPRPDRPLVVEREPIGADETFQMPMVPVRPAPPVEAPVLRIPTLGAPLRDEDPVKAAPRPGAATLAAPAVAPPAAPVPAASPAPRPAAVRPAPAEPTAPPVLRVPRPEAPPAPLRVETSRAGAEALPLERITLEPRPATPAADPVAAESDAAVDAPPVLRVTPAAVPPLAIVPTAPVAAQASEGAGFAPTALPPGELEDGWLSAPPRISRPQWPVLETSEPVRRRIPKRAWIWGSVVTVVFGAGWLLGNFATPQDVGQPGPFAKFMRSIGLGAPHFVAAVNSTPNGAWIAVDGKDIARRTPADVELAPGAHTLTLSLPDLGSAQVPVRGQRGDRLALEPSLNGGLEVDSSDPDTPINVSVDGQPKGYLPLRLESIAPGLHELQFTGPGMPAWAQTVQVGVRQTATLVARPMSAPATGIVKVQATLNDEQGSTPLAGAQVFVDGQLRGTTPVSLDLPRGPHSLKLSWHGETAPVQVIDLPGGNERFASFGFGLESASPQIQLLGGVHPPSADQQVVVSAAVTGLRLADIREGWLHVSTPEGLWRRYPMSAMRGARGPVLATVFPPAAFDSHGQARWYVSASTQQGDEFFSEMQSASTNGPSRAGRAK